MLYLELMYSSWSPFIRINEYKHDQFYCDVISRLTHETVHNDEKWQNLLRPKTFMTTKILETSDSHPVRSSQKKKKLLEWIDQKSSAWKQR